MPTRRLGVYTAVPYTRASAMNSDQQINWRRHIMFDPMNAHSQADDPSLMHVVQFNADAREFRRRHLLGLTSGARRRTSPKPSKSPDR